MTLWNDFWEKRKQKVIHSMCSLQLYLILTALSFLAMLFPPCQTSFWCRIFLYFSSLSIVKKTCRTYMNNIFALPYNFFAVKLIQLRSISLRSNEHKIFYFLNTANSETDTTQTVRWVMLLITPNRIFYYFREYIIYSYCMALW